MSVRSCMFQVSFEERVKRGRETVAKYGRGMVRLDSPIIIITDIYKAPFLSWARSALQICTSTIHKQQSHVITCNLLSKYTHTHTINQSILYLNVGKRWVLCADLKKLRKSYVFWKCVPECWSGVRERAFTVWLSVDRWNAQYTDVCRRSELPRGCSNLAATCQCSGLKPSDIANL